MRASSPLPDLSRLATTAPTGGALAVPGNMWEIVFMELDQKLKKNQEERDELLLERQRLLARERQRREWWLSLSEEQLAYAIMKNNASSDQMRRTLQWMGFEDGGESDGRLGRLFDRARELHRAGAQGWVTMPPPPPDLGF